MAICVGYLEQNDRSVPGTVNVVGYIAPKARWRLFDERWPRALRGEGLAAFNGQEFIDRTGEFAIDWSNDEGRRTRLMATLSRLVEQHVLRGFSCSIDLEDYGAVNQERRFAEDASGPYGVCAAVVIRAIQRWMAEHQPDDLTLCVFEDGEIDHREIRRILTAEGVDRGEPAQIWPRRWTDERGRRRVLRPFEACDLLLPGCESGLSDRLSQRAAWEHERIDRHRLLHICESLGVARRPAARSRELLV